MCEKLDEQFQSILGNDGVFLYPSHPILAPYHNEPIFYPFNFAYTGIFNALGYPVTQVPLGLSKDGFPLGLQVAGTMNNDRLTIAVAGELERGFKGWVEPGSNS
jgi:fatty acid amide hydrolase 2